MKNNFTAMSHVSRPAPLM